MNQKIKNLKELTQSRTQAEKISSESVEIAWNNRYDYVNNSAEAFYLLAGLNLLNTAIKQKEYKKQLSYIGIKKNVSRLLTFFAKTNNNYVEKFWINPEEQNCAYIELFDLQFSFHNILMNDTLKNYVNSTQNRIEEWGGVRLQRISEEIFLIALEHKLKTNLGMLN